MVSSWVLSMSGDGESSARVPKLEDDLSKFRSEVLEEDGVEVSVLGR